MSEYKKMFKLFFVGQEDKEIKWLEDMSRNGYHLINVSFGVYYTFEIDTKRNYKYMIDYKENYCVDDDYISFYEDMDLKYITTTNGYCYFRGDDNIKNSDIISNDKGRYLGRLNVHSKTILLVSLLNLFIFIFSFTPHHESMSNLMLPISYLNLFLGVIGLLIYTSLILKVNKMKKDNVQSMYKIRIKDFDLFYKLNIICILVFIFFLITLIFNL